MPPRLEPVDYDPFEGAKGFFPTFDAAAPASAADLPQPLFDDFPVSAGARPVNRLFGTGGEQRFQTWPERLLRSAFTLPHDVVSGEVPVETRAAIPGAVWPGSQDVQMEPNLLGKALGMTQRFAIPGPQGEIARAQDLSGVMAGGPLIERPGAATLGSGAVRPGEAALPKTEVAPPFYSAVEAAVREAPQGTMTPEQWRGYLSNRPGVKAEELDWVGLPEGKKVTRQQMLDHLDEHGVQVKEVEKKGGDGEPPLTEDEYYTGLDDRTREAVLADYPKRPGESSDAYYDRVANVWDHYQEAAADQLAQEGILHPDEAMAATGGPKYGEYQLPGGENYREKLFTLPKKEGKGSADWQEFDKIRQMDYEDRVATGVQPRYEELVNRFGMIGRDSPELGNYVSSHWDEPNVLAHVRMNDRDVPGVGKTLHLEELQSDWHQAGRKEGYRQEVPQAEKEASTKRAGDTYRQLADVTNRIEETTGAKLTAQEFNRVRDAVENARNVDDIEAIVKKHPSLDTPEFHQAAHAYNDAHVGDIVMTKRAGSGVPDAPFKTTWPDMVLKRMIREASENGYDAISWTPGEAQAARYDLSKQVENINVKPPIGSGDRHVTVNAKSGVHASALIDAQGKVTKGYDAFRDAEGKHLSDLVGKEMAERLLKADKETKFEGEGLKLGGEGMKGFYDKILVDKANALAKKFGGKVEYKSLHDTEIHPVNAGNGTGSVNYEVRDPFGDSGQYFQFGTRKEAEDYVKNNFPMAPILRLTPQMKDTALRKGFPLFSSGVPFPLIPVDHDPFAEDK